MKKLFKNDKNHGITLIALVVTIVVLLILAGVTITFVLGEGGILDMAKEAAEKTNKAIQEDQRLYGDLVTDIDNLLSNLTTNGSFDEIGKVNSPKLGTGMKAIVWNEESQTWITPKTNEEWYNYDEHRWANAQTSDGSMWVWIPRYAYQIASNYHDGGKGKSGTINIKFLKGTSNESADGETPEWKNVSGEGNWNIHPAFRDGRNNNYVNGEWNAEIEGIWVAKFEASHSDARFNEDGAIIEGKSDTLKVVPNVTSWRSITMDKMYTTCLNYNSPLNSHMMKNSEWGAVAYLAQSSYGKESEVAMNQCSSFLTGMGPGEGDDGVRAESPYAYDDNGIEAFSEKYGYLSEQGKKASTTGNETGIYDMSGGAWDRVAAYVNNGHSNLVSNGESLVNGKPYTKNIYDSPSKTGSNSDVKSNRDSDYEDNKALYGDAIYETSLHAWASYNAWYGNITSFPFSYGPFWSRGGNYVDEGSTGLFYFTGGVGAINEKTGFRPVLIP